MGGLINPKNIVMFGQFSLYKMEGPMSTIKDALLNTQRYKLAATGAGVILCQQRSQHSFRALLSMRTLSVGVGYGITGGGFVENGSIFAQPRGFVIQTAEEAWRESTEENLGFAELFPLEEFLERAQLVSALHVRIDDENGVHGCNYFALTVTDEEWEQAALLAPGPERDGPLIEMWVCFEDVVLHRSEAEIQIRLLLPDGREAHGGFYHQHELRALGQIAWHVQKSRLWQPTASL